MPLSFVALHSNGHFHHPAVTAAVTSRGFNKVPWFIETWHVLKKKKKKVVGRDTELDLALKILLTKTPLSSKAPPCFSEPRQSYSINDLIPLHLLLTKNRVSETEGIYRR